MIVDQPQQLIDQKRHRFGAIVPSRRSKQQPPRDLGTARCQRTAQQFEHRWARRRAAARCHKRGNLSAQRTAINDRALVRRMARARWIGGRRFA